MNLSSIAITGAFILCLSYIVLAFVAYQRLNEENKKIELSRLLAFTFWWPFYNVYVDGTMGLRLAGGVVLVSSIIVNVIWFTQN